MDLDDFLEQDILVYLDNIVKYGVQDKETSEGETVEALLAEKNLSQDEKPEPTTTTESSSEQVSINSSQVNITKTTQTPASSQSEQVTEQQPTPKKAMQPTFSPKTSTAPEKTATPAWVDELEHKTVEQQAELETIINLKDSLNDMQFALADHHVDKAKALYDHLLHEAQKIAFHPQEKQFLLDQLDTYNKKIASEQALREEKEDGASLTQQKKSKQTKQATPAELQEKKDFVSKKNEASQEKSTHNKTTQSSLLTKSSVDLPPSFLDEETTATYSYVEGVKAIHQQQKTKALEIFLQLLKERPSNIAVKIRLQEAIELP